MFFCLFGLAQQACQQRSGADELNGFSGARSSPLICAADIVVAFVTLVFGYAQGLGFRGSAALYVLNTRCADPTVKPIFDDINLYTVLSYAVNLFCGIKLFAAQHAPYEVYVWAAFFVGAPIIHFSMRVVEMLQAQVEPQIQVDRLERVTTIADGDAGIKLLTACDIIWCLAYSVQFWLWLWSFGELMKIPPFGGKNTLYTYIGIAVSIAVATAVSWFGHNYLYEMWSLRHWGSRETRIGLISGFMLLISFNFKVLPPLGAFSFIVIELWVLALCSCFVDWVRHGRVRSSTEKIDVYKENLLKLRWNPLLRTAPAFWRQTLSNTFVLGNLTFAGLYYVFVYNEGQATTPSFVESLGRRL